MIRRSLFLFLAVLLACVQAQVSVSGELSVLQYSSRRHDAYQALHFKRPDGTMFTPFDEGLRFYEPGTNSLSPDKQYSIVNFSAEGDLADSSGVSVHSEYLCAFVRMKDGCVVHVAQDAVCGGEWRPPHQWSVNIEPIFDNPPNAADIYAAYSSKHKTGSQVSQPPILAYLAEGTAFDNLLACDPPSAGNRSAYSKLLVQLQRDGDTENANKLKKTLTSGRSGTSIHVAPVESGDWVGHAVISKRAYLYAMPEKSSVTTAYLVQGDSVLVNESSLSKGFVASRYRRKNGNVIERWIRCEDVNACSTGGLRKNSPVDGVDD
ncbi:hypothetical protein FCJ61_10955 [Burkholderia metallica]|uniref:hypothetical protein n=1 Tax=Burkholderia metallica TaxID=488729 RepID=UPI001575AC51|nr:hypothetical protein [Burkholderia metallica]NTZ04620.1 hypothetical protein [Burkholderia metallica]NTZ83505.1 hypothetical protein [Burkholderia metallica]